MPTTTATTAPAHTHPIAPTTPPLDPPADRTFLQQLEIEIQTRVQAHKLIASELAALQKARDILAHSQLPGDVLQSLVDDLQIPVAKPATHPAATQPALQRLASTRKLRTIADCVEQILMTSKDGARNGIHVDALIPLLIARYKLNLSSKHLVNTLNRWVSRGKRFRRTAPNTFALAD